MDYDHSHTMLWSTVVQVSCDCQCFRFRASVFWVLSLCPRQIQLIAPSWPATLSRSCMWFSGIQRYKLVSWKQDAIFAASKERSLVQRWNFGDGGHSGGKPLPRGAFSRKWARKLTDSLCWVQTESVLCSVICAISRMSQHLCVSP